MTLKTAALALLLAGAATPALAAPAADPVFDPGRGPRHVTFLADDLLEGRDTGSRGFAIAANYVAAQFRAMGLEPAGPDGSYFQRFTVREARAEGEPQLVFTRGAQTRTVAGAAQVLIRPSLIETSVALTRALVFVRLRLDRPDLGFDDYRGLMCAARCGGAHRRAKAPPANLAPTSMPRRP